MFTAVIEQLEQRRLLSAGSVDTSFGSHGVIVGDASTASNDIDLAAITSLAQQSDGEVIAAGSTVFPNDLFAARLHSNGQIDRNFGDLGTVQLNLGNQSIVGSIPPGNLYVLAGNVYVTVDHLDRIVLACSVNTDGGIEFLVARFTQHGKIDKTFGRDGISRSLFPGLNATAQAVAIGPDNRIVVAGYAEAGSDPQTSRMAVARFTASGELDTGFSVDGLQTLDLNSGQDSANAVTVMSDGRIVLAGKIAAKDQDGDFAVVRLTATGHLDPTFDGNGVADINFGGDDAADALLLQSDGRIVVAGRSFAAFDQAGDIGASYVGGRLNANGSPDTFFSSAGQGSLAVRDATPVSQIARTKTGDYRIVFGYGELRLTSTGAADQTFSSDGLEFFDTPFDSIDQRSLALASGGLLRVVTEQPSALYPNLFHSSTVEIYNSSDTLLTTAPVPLDDGISDAEVDASGKLVEASISGPDYLFYRFDSDGTLDPSFGGGGVSLEAIPLLADYPQLLPLGDGKMIVNSIGHDIVDTDSVGVLLHRLNTNGTLDSGYPSPDYPGLFTNISGEGGVPHLYPDGSVSDWLDNGYNGDHIGILVTPDGKATGWLLPNSGQQDPLAWVDRVIPYNGGTYVVGRYVVATFDDAGDVTVVSAKYVTESPNPAFGNDGELVAQFDFVFAQSDGKLLYRSGGGLSRLTLAGKKDTSFGNSGAAAAGYTNFTADSAGRIIAWKVNKNGDVQIARFSANGHVDKSFGNNGVAIVHPAVKGDVNLMVTPKNDLVITSVAQAGENATWWATRIHGS